MSDEGLLFEFMVAHDHVLDTTRTRDERRDALAIRSERRKRILELMEKGRRYEGLED